MPKAPDLDDALNLAKAGHDNTADEKISKISVKRFGIEDNRCRDIPCCVIFIVFLIGWFIIWGMAANSGDAGRLIHGIDYTGNTCGSVAVTAAKPDEQPFKKWDLPTLPLDKKYGTYFDKAKDTPITSWNDFFTARNVISYPRTNVDKVLQDLNNAKVPRFWGVCLPGCPSDVDYVCSYKGSFMAAEHCEKKTTNKPANLQMCQNKVYSEIKSGVINGDDKAKFEKECSKQTLNSTEVIYHCIAARSIEIDVWCSDPGIGPNHKHWQISSYRSDSSAPDSDKNVNTTMNTLSKDQCKTKYIKTQAFAGFHAGDLISTFEATSNTFSQWLGDVQDTMAAILVTGLLFTVILAVVWLFFMRKAPTIISWTFIILALVSMFILMLFFFEKAGLLGAKDVLANMKQELAKKASISPDMIPLTVPAAAREDLGNAELYKWSGIISAIMFGISTIITIAIRDKIAVAIQVMAEASKAIRDLPLMIFYPVWNFIAIVLVMLHWMFVGALIMSSGQIINNSKDSVANAVSAAKTSAMSTANFAADKLAEKTPEEYNSYTPEFRFQLVNQSYGMDYIEEDPALQSWLLLYHTIGTLWTYSILIALGYYVIARAVSQWYFKEGKYKARLRNKTVVTKVEDLTNLGCCKVNFKQDVKETPIADAFLSAWYYHMGTLIFGAFVTVLCKILRIFFYLVAEFSKKIPASDTSKIVVFLVKCTACMLDWFRKFVEIVSRNAYVYVAMYSNLNFCEGAKKSFKLVSKPENIAQIWVVDVISDFIMFIGKMFIVAFNGWIAFAWVNGLPHKPTSVFLPVIVSCLLTYFVASGIMQVYEMTIDTIIVCYLEDKTVNKGGPYNMSKNLKDAMQVESMDPFNMKPQDSFYFSKDISERGKISLGIGWSMKPVQAAGGSKPADIDIDASAICFNKDGEMVDWLGYWRDDATGQLKRKHKSGGRLFDWVANDTRESPLKQGAITHSGDATKGSIAENGEGIDEIVTVDLSQLDAANVEVVAFCMFVFKGGDFEHVKHVYTHGQELTDGIGKQVCRFSFSPSEEDMKKTGMIFSKLRRNVVENEDGEATHTFWELEATGSFTSGKTVTAENLDHVKRLCFPEEVATRASGKGAIGKAVDAAVAGIAVAAM